MSNTVSSYGQQSAPYAYGSPAQQPSLQRYAGGADADLAAAKQRAQADSDTLMAENESGARLGPGGAQGRQSNTIPAPSA